MSGYLVVRLAADSEQASWIVVSDQGHRLSRTATGALTSAASHAAHRKVLLLVPGLDAVTTRVNLPVQRQSRVEKMLPYTLEDSVADDVDGLLFAAGARRTDGEMPVAIVSRDLVESWLAHCESAGLTVDAVFADVQGVPETPGNLTLLLEDRKIYGRLPDREAFVFEDLTIAEVLEVLAAAAGSDSALEHVVVYGDGAGHARREHELAELRDRVSGIDISVLADGLLPRLAVTLVQQPGCNLLQGPYRPKSNWAEIVQPWRAPAFLLLALVVIAGAVQAGNNFRLSRQDQALTAVLENGCRDAFAVERLAACEAEIRSRLALADGTGDAAGQPAFLDTLLAVANARDERTILQALSFRDGVSNLRVIAPDVPALDRFAQSLGDGGRFRVNIQSANPGETGIEGRLQVAEQNP